MEKLKLGIIGMSEGNGHPYSWAAIFNGFDMNYMKDCPFPAIPEYLSVQKYPENFLYSEAEVTHVYTQDKSISEHIAKSSKIPNVASNLEDMIGKVDALLLARDDAENHFYFSKSYLEAGIPIYIDKPLAQLPFTAKFILENQKFDSQVYTCSALRYAKEFELDAQQREDIGKIISIQAYTPKSWEKYAIHVIEPVLVLLNFPKVSEFRCNKINNYHRLSFVANEEIIVTISNLQKANTPLYLEVTGEKKTVKLIFKDSFNAFRAALKEFIIQVKTRENRIPRAQTLQVIEIIEKGLL
ncbi:MAG: Gfo/Idh/MocA family oxidoreductase [Bernardetiaceae bacterium]|nr:Gfo/Idh/MocA family oxidoreductase [Bernardetiaceae bacterium]